MQEDHLEDLTKEIKKLQKRVQIMEDREAVRDLTASYMQAMHDARWEDALECFAEEAEYDHGLLGELRGKSDLRTFYTEFMPTFEEAGGWAMDLLADPVIQVEGDNANARWFLLTLLIDPDNQKPAWSMATLEYEYERKPEGWRFIRNRCIHEHILAPYDKGWGAEGGSKLSNASETMPNHHFEKLNAQGGKQRPGRTCRSIRGWTVPTLEPE